MFYADSGTTCSCGDGPDVRAVGWLSDEYPYTKGEVPADFLERLRQHVLEPWEPSFCFMGYHTCELCDRNPVSGRSNLYVPCGTVIYIAPTMIMHYVEEHGYRPPDTFIEALLVCPEQKTPEYMAAVQPFLHHWHGDTPPVQHPPTAIQASPATDKKPLSKPRRPRKYKFDTPPLSRRVVRRVREEILPDREKAAAFVPILVAFCRDIFGYMPPSTPKEFDHWSRTNQGTAQLGLICDIIASADWEGEDRTEPWRNTPEQKAANERYRAEIRLLASLLRLEIDAEEARRTRPWFRWKAR